MELDIPDEMMEMLESLANDAGVTVGEYVLTMIQFGIAVEAVVRDGAQIVVRSRDGKEIQVFGIAEKDFPSTA